MAAPDLQRNVYEIFMGAQFWSADKMQEYQRRQLTQLLRHARSYVPFYARRLDVLFRSDGSIDWDRWSEVPLVTRKDMAERRQEMQATQTPRESGPIGTVQTSGSSGTPITISVNAFTVLANNALRWRVQEWQECDWAERLCARQGTDPKVATYPEGRRGGPWGPPFIERARRGMTWELNRLTPTTEENVLFLHEHGCRYYNTGPKTAHVVAIAAERMGVPLKLDAVLAQGERVTDADREICRRVLGAKIVELYSSKEAGHMAHPCPAGRLHVNSEHVVFEIIDEDGQPCPPGVAGKVVVTPFFSLGQPLIRYEQGDITAFTADCECGRHGPVIEPVRGRTLAVFNHPDGRAVVQVMPETARESLQCQLWQMAQVGPNTYEVRYVPKVWGESGDEARFIEQFREVFFSDAEVRLVPMQEIPLTAGGKHLEYVNEYTAKSAAAG